MGFSDNFFNQTSGDEALAVLETQVKADFANNELRPSPSYARGAFTARKSNKDPAFLRTFWGDMADGGSSKNDFRIGLLWKVWALLALRCEVLREKVQRPALGPAQISNQISEFVKISDKRFEVSHAVQAMLTVNRLDSRTMEPFADVPQEILKGVAGFCANQIFEDIGSELSEVSSADELTTKLIRACNDQPSSSARTCWQTLMSSLNLSGLARRSGNSRIEDFILQYINHHGADGGVSKDISEDILSRILKRGGRQSNARSRIVGLCGSAHSGKKTVVGDLIGSLWDEAKQDYLYNLPLTGRGDPIELPVFNVDMRRSDYYRLLVKVEAFLDGLANDPNKDGSRKADTGNKDIGALLDRIGTLHKDNSALFIFMDVDGIDYHNPKRIIQKLGFRRLLRRLLSSNDESRYIVTTSMAGRRTLDDRINQYEQIVWQEMDDPTIGRMAWYLERPAEITAQLESGLLSSPERNRKVRGDGMLALAALEPDEGQAIEPYTEKIKSFVQRSANPDLDPLQYVYAQHVQEMSNAGMLQSALLIACSFDGVGENSLHECLDRWIRDAPADFGVELTDDAKNANLIVARVIEGTQLGLEHLHSKAKQMFLRLREPVSHDHKEYGFTEKGGREGDPLPKTWSFSDEASAELLRAVAEADDPALRDLLPHARRIIAWAARRRAQLRKMRTGHEDSFFETQHIGRDVQSYVSLMSSLEPSEVLKDEFDSLPVFYPDLVFAVGDGFSPRMAYAYALRNLLREDIDKHHRLSMVTDQDSLRMSLYVLPFIEKKPLSLWSVTMDFQEERFQLDDLCTDIPPALRAVLDDLEILDLLVTIAVTANYCDQPKLINWAKDRALSIIQSETSGEIEDATLRSFSRLLLAQIDCAIDHGYWVYEGNSQLSEGVLPTANILGEIDNIIKGYLPRLPVEFSDDLPCKETRERLRFYMQLQARRAELLWLLDADKVEYDRIYGGLAKLEQRLAPLHKYGLPIVHSGRSARRRIRSLTNDYPVLSNNPELLEDPDAIRDCSVLLETNLSRLVAYSGGERLGVLLDHARISMVKGEFASARNIMDELRYLSDSTIVSLKHRIEILTMDIAVFLTVLENDDQKTTVFTDRHWRNAQEALNALAEISEVKKLQPASVIARHLQSRLSLQAKRFKIDGIDPNRVQTPAQTAADFNAAGIGGLVPYI